MQILNMFIPMEDIIFAVILVVLIGICFLIYRAYKRKIKVKNQHYETLLKDTKNRLRKVAPKRHISPSADGGNIVYTDFNTSLIFKPPPGSPEIGRVSQLQHERFGTLLMQLDIPRSYRCLLMLFLFFTPIIFAGLLFVQDFSLVGFLRGMDSESNLTGLLLTIVWLVAFVAGIFYMKHPFRVQFYRHCIIAASPMQTRIFSYEEIVDIDFKYYHASLKKSDPNSGFVCTISLLNGRTLVLRQNVYAHLEEKMIFWQKYLVKGTSRN